MQKRNLILIGFMGVGKSSVGKELSLMLKRELIDTDTYIEAKMRMSISEIFESFGEPYFRGLERELCQSLSERRSKIVATGGGIIKNADNIENLKQGGIIIYLKSYPENIAYNLRYDNSRPLLRVDNKLKKISELMAEREHYYNEYADIIIDVSNIGIRETLDRILGEVEVYENENQDN